MRIASKVFDVEVTGPYAMFTDPVSKLSGERCSYEIPTYSALAGILASIYWKPTIEIFVDRVRIMEPIRIESRGVKLPYYDQPGSDLAYAAYLKDVRYQIQCHLEWNLNRPEFAQDRDAIKHINMFEHSLKHGGRRDIFLGTRECQGYALPCKYGEGKSPYQGTEISFGLMYHSTTYAESAYDKATADHITTNMWFPVMKNGEIEFLRPSQTPIHKTVRKMKMKNFPQKKEKPTGEEV